MTTTATRTDVHRPSALDPEAYEYQAAGDYGSPSGSEPADLRELNNAIARLEDAGYTMADHQVEGSCGHCGAHHRFVALVAREDIHEMLLVGEQCLSNRFDSGLSHARFQELRKAAQLNRERTRIDARVAAFVEAHPVAAWLSYVGNIDEPGTVYLPFDEFEGYAHVDEAASTYVSKVTGTWKQFDILRDLGDKLRRYAELSDKQVALVDRLLTQVSERYEAHLEREATKADVPAAPEGRVAFEGEVVSVKFYDNDFGGTTKILVVTDAGWKAFVARPAAIWEAEKGDRVALTATLERSATDHTFAKGSRPAKARIVAKAAA
jgi:hypothetical protein